MRPTRQLWARLALAGFLAAFAVLLDRPLPLAGAVLIGAWVLATQHSFLVALERATDRLSVSRSTPSPTVRADASTPVSFDATLEDPTALRLEVDAGLPSATATPDRSATTLALGPDSTGATETVPVEWPVAGRHRFERARVTATDGRFVETFAAADRPIVSVEPRGPRDVHVGASGDRLASTYGAHTVRQSGRGLEPAELREQVPGDSVTRIDWKATARLATPHVREYETETTRRTLLVVDHRRSLAAGPPARTKLDYLREAMLTTVESARERDDPVGLAAVDDGGVTVSIDPSATAGTYAAVRRELRELDPTRPDTSMRARDGRPRPGSETNRSKHPHTDYRNRTGRSGSTRSTARRAARDLEGDSSAFARTLSPFYADAKRDRRLNGDHPLLEAVRTTVAATDSTTVVAIVTDDTDPAELRETVSLARERAAGVTVFLAPTVLYDSDALSDPDRAADRYREFEALRRDLDRLEGVRAFEVGPGDRLASVLEASHGRARGDRR